MTGVDPWAAVRPLLLFFKAQLFEIDDVGKLK
jgi:hypothetical protein